MFWKIRMWLIQQLAGRDGIAVNLTIDFHNREVVTARGSRALYVGCYFNDGTARVGGRDG